jgi:gas vesicle protein
MSKKSEQAVLLAFLAGALVAAGAALLFTPKTGREVREKLVEAKEGALDKLKHRVKRAKGDPLDLDYDGGDCWI